MMSPKLNLPPVFHRNTSIRLPLLHNSNVLTTDWPQLQLFSTPQGPKIRTKKKKKYKQAPTGAQGPRVPKMNIFKN